MISWNWRGGLATHCFTHNTDANMNTIMNNTCLVHVRTQMLITYMFLETSFNMRPYMMKIFLTIFRK